MENSGRNIKELLRRITVADGTCARIDRELGDIQSAMLLEKEIQTFEFVIDLFDDPVFFDNIWRVYDR